jgi:transketolase
LELTTTTVFERSPSSASAAAGKLFTEFGLTSERVVADVKKALA